MLHVQLVGTPGVHLDQEKGKYVRLHPLDMLCVQLLGNQASR